jgi:hypothetical protein
MRAMDSTGQAAPVAPLPWQPGSALEEQRGYPRITLEIPVAFRNSSGQHCAASLRNLSPDGLQVRCNIVTAQMIYPGGKLQADNAPILQATAVLPLAGGPETLSVGVRLLYFTTADENPNCILGFQFLNLRPKARRIIETFFVEQLRDFYHDEGPADGYRSA